MGDMMRVDRRGDAPCIVHGGGERDAADVRSEREVVRRVSPWLRWLALGSTVAVVSLVAACSGGGASDAEELSSDDGGRAGNRQSGPLTTDEMRAEYAAEVATLTFPAGWVDPGAGTWEPEPGVNGELVDHSFEPGFGTMTADQEWGCAWKREWLESGDPDSERAAASLEQLELMKDVYYWTVADDSTREAEKAMISAARLGDPTSIAAYVESNC